MSGPEAAAVVISHNTIFQVGYAASRSALIKTAATCRAVFAATVEKFKLTVAVAPLLIIPPPLAAVLPLIVQLVRLTVAAPVAVEALTFSIAPPKLAAEVAVFPLIVEWLTVVIELEVELAMLATPPLSCDDALLLIMLLVMVAVASPLAKASVALHAEKLLAVFPVTLESMTLTVAPWL